MKKSKIKLIFLTCVMVVTTFSLPAMGVHAENDSLIKTDIIYNQEHSEADIVFDLDSQTTKYDIHKISMEDEILYDKQNNITLQPYHTEENNEYIFKIIYTENKAEESKNDMHNIDTSDSVENELSPEEMESQDIIELEKEIKVKVDGIKESKADKVTGDEKKEQDNEVDNNITDLSMSKLSARSSSNGDFYFSYALTPMRPPEYNGNKITFPSNSLGLARSNFTLDFSRSFTLEGDFWSGPDGVTLAFDSKKEKKVSSSDQYNTGFSDMNLSTQVGLYGQGFSDANANIDKGIFWNVLGTTGDYNTNSLFHNGVYGFKQTPDSPWGIPGVSSPLLLDTSVTLGLVGTDNNKESYELDIVPTGADAQQSYSMVYAVTDSDRGLGILKVTIGSFSRTYSMHSKELFDDYKKVYFTMTGHNAIWNGGPPLGISFNNTEYLDWPPTDEGTRFYADRDANPATFETEVGGTTGKLVNPGEKILVKYSIKSKSIATDMEVPIQINNLKDNLGVNYKGTNLKVNGVSITNNEAAYNPSVDDVSSALNVELKGSQYTNEITFEIDAPSTGSTTLSTDALIGYKFMDGITTASKSLKTYPKIVYDGNGNTGGNKPADVTVLDTGQPYQLAAAGNMTRKEVVFAGWSFTKQSEPVSIITGTGIIEEIPVSKYNGPGNIQVYAVWQHSKIRDDDGGMYVGDRLIVSGNVSSYAKKGDTVTVKYPIYNDQDGASAMDFPIRISEVKIGNTTIPLSDIKDVKINGTAATANNGVYTMNVGTTRDSANIFQFSFTLPDDLLNQDNDVILSARIKVGSADILQYELSRGGRIAGYPTLNVGNPIRIDLDSSNADIETAIRNIKGKLYDDAEVSLAHDSTNLKLTYKIYEMNGTEITSLDNLDKNNVGLYYVMYTLTDTRTNLSIQAKGYVGIADAMEYNTDHSTIILGNHIEMLETKTIGWTDASKGSELSKLADIKVYKNDILVTAGIKSTTGLSLSIPVDTELKTEYSGVTLTTRVDIQADESGFVVIPKHIELRDGYGLDPDKDAGQLARVELVSGVNTSRRFGIKTDKMITLKKDGSSKEYIVSMKTTSGADFNEINGKLQLATFIGQIKTVDFILTTPIDVMAPKGTYTGTMTFYVESLN